MTPPTTSGSMPLASPGAARTFRRRAVIWSSSRGSSRRATRHASGHWKARCVLSPIPGGRRTVTWPIADASRPQSAGGHVAEDEAPICDNMELQSSYIVESCGELLWVFVQIDTGSAYYKEILDFRASDIDILASALSVSVYTRRQGEAAESSKPCWVGKDGRSLANQVLFLGKPSSFGVEAARIAMSGGCAYFVDNRLLSGRVWSKLEFQLSRLFRYSFQDNRAEFVEELSDYPSNHAYMWITSRISIAPIEEIRGRLEALNGQKAAWPRQQCESFFKIHVGNLAPKVDNCQLRQFFGKLGKVSHVRVVCDRGTGHSRGFGFVYMSMASTVDDEPAEAVAKLHGLVTISLICS
ncbi:hypothetical protein HU200_002856 [Digitaria exilis]|uniref:RRM domain-containing protein n=1 Tax=Digitaria exilis TaxID=1010633 RepID=A0A835FW93_9POAL|nr:hypothetical protein HU200_002856 [Digitaria exilis]CAB3467904.1 unnamed protein product [Digitaria exilis]